MVFLVLRFVLRRAVLVLFEVVDFLVVVFRFFRTFLFFLTVFPFFLLGAAVVLRGLVAAVVFCGLEVDVEAAGRALLPPSASSSSMACSG